MLDLVQWETHTWPAAGEYAQGVINEQFPEDIDIFIGMMGSYFGTPTRLYGSGTEEEFHIAHKSWKESGFPKIMFYFSAALPSSLTEIDAGQLALRNKFKKEIANLGVKYDEYQDLVTLRSRLHRHLNSEIYKILDAERENQNASEKTMIAPDQSAGLLPNYALLVSKNSALAASDLLSLGTDYMGALQESMQALTAEAGRFSRDISKDGKQLNKPGVLIDEKRVRIIITRVNKAFDRFQRALKQRIPELRNSFEGSLMSLQRVLEISSRHDVSSLGDLKQLESPLADLRNQIAELTPINAKLINSLEEWPREGDLGLQRLRLQALLSDMNHFVQQACLLADEVRQELIEGE